MSDVVTIGDATLYHGDCMDVMAGFPECFRVDALVTDPPYGVNGGSGTIGLASAKTKYVSAFTDSRENVRDFIVPAIKRALSMAERGVITPGTPCAWYYPHPDDMGAIYQPATTGLNKWGRETTQPVLYYGKDPRAGLTIQPKHIQITARAESCGHPCPKPLRVMEWLVDRTSLPGETVFDPFMGSGTTGVACANLGRKFIGIEIEERYFQIACERITAAQAQGRMFG